MNPSPILLPPSRVAGSCTTASDVGAQNVGTACAASSAAFAQAAANASKSHAAHAALPADELVGSMSRLNCVWWAFNGGSYDYTLLTASSAPKVLASDRRM